MNRLTNAMGVVAFTLMLAVVGCNRPEPEPLPHGKDSGKRAPEFPTNVTAYEAKGVLKEIRADGWKALIEHEDIPGYMEAMTMLLDVKTTNELAAVRPGDAIRFRMLVTDTDGWIDRVQRIGTNATPATATGSASPVTNRAGSKFEIVEELSPGDPLPDCTLTNQLGQRIRLSDFKGKALAFTFIFTRCPFPTYCPRMNNNFGAVQRQLLKANVGTNWHLISISFDPEFDTPTRLAAYAQVYHHDPARWSFVTGTADDIRNLGERFGLLFYRSKGSFEHNVRTVVVSPDGRVHKVFAGNEWRPEDLAAEMQKFILLKP